MITNEEISKVLRNAKIIHIFILAAVLICVIILIVLPDIGVDPIFSSDDPILTILAVILGVVSVINITIGYFYGYSWSKRKVEEQKVRNKVYSIVTLRGSLLESTALNGLILGVVGVGWGITAPFFVVAAGTLLHTFPTEERLKKMIKSNMGTETTDK